MRSIPILMTAALLAAVPALASQTTAKGVEEPAAAPTPSVAVVVGCYSSPGELVSAGTFEFNSISKCAVDTCAAQGHLVGASMGGNECYCGDEYPPKAALVNDTMCNIGCTGYDWDACSYFAVSFLWWCNVTELTYL
jgi:cell wall integrity and stress response component